MCRSNAGLTTALFALGLCISPAEAGGEQGSLIETVKQADVGAVRALLDQGVDVNAPAVDGTTALHWAVHRDDAVVAELLI